ncbi:hypothetical protein ACFW04_008651 [Cataglyphis niger]
MKLYKFLGICDDKSKLIDYLIDQSSIFDHNSLLFRCYNVEYIHNYHKKQFKKKCNMKFSIFHNTWFAESRLDLQTVCQFIAYFLHIKLPRHTFLINELEISDNPVLTDQILKKKVQQRRIIEGQWIFDGIENSTKQLFINIIKKWIKPETIISGCKKSYQYLTKHEARANISQYGTRKEHYVGYLAEFLFRQRYNFCIYRSFFQYYNYVSNI